MPKFFVTLDVKETIWHRCTADIEADTLEDAQQEIIRRRETDEYEDMESNYILETGKPLTQIENFLLDNQDLCLPDSPEFVDEVDTYDIYDFPEDENYKIDDDDHN